MSDGLTVRDVLQVAQRALTKGTENQEQIDELRQKQEELVEDHLEGRVLNATAGKTRLDHDGVVRNDLNPGLPADTHHDVQAADEHWPDQSFGAVVLDPPFDEGQADQRYGGWHASDFSIAREALEPLVRSGGRAISIGWTTYSFAEQFDGWAREELHIYQRGPIHPDFFLTVDRRLQRTLADGSRYVSPEADRDV